MKKILFFDDESYISKILIDNLQKNYEWNKDKLGEITFVPTADELFNTAQNSEYDLFVLDIMVPIDQVKKMDIFSKKEIEKMQGGDNTGVVFAEKIRSLKDTQGNLIYQNVPILFLSARIQPSQMMGNADYLEKPAFASEVSDKMKELLNI